MHGVVSFVAIEVPQAGFVCKPRPFQFQYPAREIISQFSVSADTLLRCILNLNWDPRARPGHPWPVTPGRFKCSVQLSQRFGLGITHASHRPPFQNVSQISVLLESSASVSWNIFQLTN